MAKAVEIEGNLGDVAHDKIIWDQAEKLVDFAVEHTRENSRKMIHHITRETSRSLRTSRSRTQTAVTGEVFTRVPWAIVLEFRQAAFLRPGIWLARRGIRREMKKLFGPGYRASMRFRARRRR